MFILTKRNYTSKQVSFVVVVCDGGGGVPRKFVV